MTILYADSETMVMMFPPVQLQRNTQTSLCRYQPETVDGLFLCKKNKERGKTGISDFLKCSNKNSSKNTDSFPMPE